MDKEKREDFELDNFSTFWLKVNNDKYYDDIAIYTVGHPANYQNKAEVTQAKQKELQNLFKYDMFEEVDDIGQERVVQMVYQRLSGKGIAIVRFTNNVKGIIEVISWKIH